ncbi:MAG: hypothetical protein H0W44_02585 [Gammaproteobacteria bacterium]|nr:hypothetical protein [Gammaproteobacteria bacterium]
MRNFSVAADGRDDSLLAGWVFGMCSRISPQTSGYGYGQLCDSCGQQYEINWTVVAGEQDIIAMHDYYGRRYFEMLLPVPVTGEQEFIAYFRNMLPKLEAKLFS